MERQISVKEEIYTHEHLWRSASRLLEHAEANKEVSFYFVLPSLLLSFMAYEAFVNFCGFVLYPELWKNEKAHFKGKGIEGKLEKIVAKLPGFSWRKGERPYQKLRHLEDFRDIVSHGKVVAKEYVAEQKEDGSHFQFKHSWDTYLSVEAVKSARGDIKLFCQSILVELRKQSEHPQLTFDAFEGSLGHASGEGE